MAVSYHPLSGSMPLGSPPPGRGYRVVDTNDPRRIAKCMKEFLWAGNVWEGGHRLKANFLYSDWCVLDIDDTTHEYPLDYAIKAFCDKIHVIGITRNHGRDKDGVTCDRYRIAVPWETRIKSLPHYQGNMDHLYEMIPSLDPSTLHGAQPFFRCLEIVSLCDEGYKQDVLERCREENDRLCGSSLKEDIEKKRLVLSLRGRMPIWVENFLITGDANFGNRHHRVLGAAIEMAEHGFTRADIEDKLRKIPISRSYKRGEVEDIARYALKDVEARLRDEDEEDDKDEDRI